MIDGAAALTTVPAAGFSDQVSDCVSTLLSVPCASEATVTVTSVSALLSTVITGNWRPARLPAKLTFFAASTDTVAPANAFKPAFSAVWMAAALASNAMAVLVYLTPSTTKERL